MAAGLFYLVFLGGVIATFAKWDDIQKWRAKGRATRDHWSAPPTNPEDDPGFINRLRRKP